MRDFQPPSLQNLTTDLIPSVTSETDFEREMRERDRACAELEMRLSFFERLGVDVYKLTMSFHSVDRIRRTMILSGSDGFKFKFNIPSEYTTLGREMKEKLRCVPILTFECIVCLTQATNPQQGGNANAMPACPFRFRRK